MSIGDECLCRYGSQRQTRTPVLWGMIFTVTPEPKGDAGHQPRNEEKELQTGRSVLPVGKWPAMWPVPAVLGLQVIGEGARSSLADPPFIQLPEAV